MDKIPENFLEKTLNFNLQKLKEPCITELPNQITISDFHNSNLFSEHLGTHCTLELRDWAIFKVNQDFNGGL